jgi:adenosylhomocysteine nucleosidase
MILVLTPLKIEHEILREALGASESEGLTLAIGGHGKVQFALTTSHLLQRLKPRLVVCAGSCGALSPELSPGDIVVGGTTVEHDFNLRFLQRPLPRWPADAAALARLEAMTPRSSGFKLWFGAIASGDEDVIEAERAARIRDLTGGALAVAWEGAGGARACAFHKTAFVEIRAVTDHADAAAMKDFTAHLKPGLANLAEVLKGLRR